MTRSTLSCGGDKIEILNYNQSYEKEVVDLWNKTLTADPITNMKILLFQ